MKALHRSHHTSHNADWSQAAFPLVIAKQNLHIPVLREVEPAFHVVVVILLLTAAYPKSMDVLQIRHTQSFARPGLRILGNFAWHYPMDVEGGLKSEFFDMQSSLSTTKQCEAHWTVQGYRGSRPKRCVSNPKTAKPRNVLSCFFARKLRREEECVAATGGCVIALCHCLRHQQQSAKFR